MSDFYAKHWILTAPTGVVSSGPLVATDLDLCDKLIEQGWKVRGPYMSAECVRDEVVEHALPFEDKRARINVFRAAATLESIYGLDPYEFDTKAEIPTPYEIAMKQEHDR